MCEDERPVPPRHVEAERPEDGRRGPQRVERAEAVVDEPRLDQLAGADGPARLVLGLVHDHRPAAIGEHVRGYEPVVTGADHHRVWRNWRHKPTLPPHF